MVCSCSTSEYLKKDLLRPWSKQLEMEIPCDEHFSAYYKKGEKEVLFNGGPHKTGLTPHNYRFAYIEKSFEKFNPDFVLVEGIHFAKGTSPKDIKDKVSDCKKSNFEHCYENIYSINLALKNNTSFRGAEPNDQQIIKAISPRYSRRDYIAMYWYRNMVRWKRQKTLSLRQYMPKMKESMTDKFGVPLKMKFSEFKKWYVKHSKKDFNPNNFTTDDLEPLNNENSTYFQKMAHAINRAREPQIQPAINFAIKNYNKILIVYGSGHYPKHRIAFEDFFGKPKISCAAKNKKNQGKPSLN